MKKVILFLFISISTFTSCAHAQDSKFDSTGKIESDKILNLSSDQVAKIKKLNQEAGAKFREIGQSNLPGYEKGQQKQALALEHKASIQKILTDSQIKTWEKHYGNMDQNEGLRDIIKDEYDARLENLEKKYEREKKILENTSLPKDEKKSKLKALKQNYKIEKDRLKNERDKARTNGVLSK